MASIWKLEPSGPSIQVCLQADSLPYLFSPILHHKCPTLYTLVFLPPSENVCSRLAWDSLPSRTLILPTSFPQQSFSLWNRCYHCDHHVTRCLWPGIIPSLFFFFFFLITVSWFSFEEFSSIPHILVVPSIKMPRPSLSRDNPWPKLD